MNEREIQVGSEVLVNGQWAIVDEVDGDTLFCLDQDGGTIETTKGQVDLLH